MTAKADARSLLLAKLGDVFREQGFEGASLAAISAATGLGKGSLYNYFPGGKEEMLTAVLAHVDDWFEREVFAPLGSAADAEAARFAIEAMFESVDNYFRSGRRVCLVGVLALAETRDRFAEAVSSYFRRWIDTLAQALMRTGLSARNAEVLAGETVAGIQGAILLSRALDSTDLFTVQLAGLRERLAR